MSTALNLAMDFSTTMATHVSALSQGVIPDPPAAAPPAVGDKIGTLVSWIKWGALVCGVIGLIWCGILMTIGRRNRSSTSADGAAGIPWVLGGLTVTSFAASIVAATVA